MPKLLIVDDNENNRAVLHDALDTDEYELFEAEDGEKALNLVPEINPDLILLDIEMPVLDGYEALKRLKANEETQHIPVIMVTALNTDSQISTCLDGGAVDHIVKPFSNTIVRARVRTALRSILEQKASLAASKPRGKVLTFIGAKGGVGTTTIALNVAAGLAKQEKTTVACELRPNFGTAAVQLEASPALNLNVLLDDDFESITPQKLQDCLITESSGLKVLLGPQSLDSIEITSAHTEAIVNGLTEMSEYTIFDLPSTFSEATEEVLRHSHFVLLVTEIEPTSLAAAQHWIEKLHSLGIGQNGMGIVATSRSHFNVPMSLTDIREKLDSKIIGVMPADPDACMMSVRSGSPVILAHPKSTISGALNALINRLTVDQIAEVQF